MVSTIANVLQPNPVASGKMNGLNRSNSTCIPNVFTFVSHTMSIDYPYLSLLINKEKNSKQQRKAFCTGCTDNYMMIFLTTKIHPKHFFPDCCSLLELPAKPEYTTSSKVISCLFFICSLPSNVYS